MDELVICNKSDLTAIADIVRTELNTGQTYNVTGLSSAVGYAVASKLDENTVLTKTPQTLSQEEAQQVHENIQTDTFLMDKSETWVFTLDDGTTVTKKVVLA